MAAFVWPQDGWYYLTETKAEAICLILINLSCLRHAALKQNKKGEKKRKEGFKHVALKYIKVHQEAILTLAWITRSQPSSYSFTVNYTLY